MLSQYLRCSLCLKLSYIYVGTLGFEPKACGLKVQCSTYWATYPYNDSQGC